jgi:hypothetical protein
MVELGSGSLRQIVIAHRTLACCAPLYWVGLPRRGGRTGEFTMLCAAGRKVAATVESAHFGPSVARGGNADDRFRVRIATAIPTATPKPKATFATASGDTDGMPIRHHEPTHAHPAFSRQLMTGMRAPQPVSTILEP